MNRTGMTRIGEGGACSCCGAVELDCLCWASPAEMQAWREAIRAIACLARKRIAIGPQAVSIHCAIDYSGKYKERDPERDRGRRPPKKRKGTRNDRVRV